MIPAFDERGNLPPGIHWATWQEIVDRFGYTPWRQHLLERLEAALASLRVAGCRRAYVDGSFVTAKAKPGDFDACWDMEDVKLALLDPVFFPRYAAQRVQKVKYGGDFFALQKDKIGGMEMLQRFQVDRETHTAKGIVGLDLLEVQS